MSTISRTVRNLWKVGVKDYFHQMNNIGDTKAGLLVGSDRFGNKYYQNEEELPHYASKDFDAAQIEPGWHAWMSHVVDNPPSKDPTLAYKRRAWEDTDAKTIPNLTMTRGAYKPYNTVKPKHTSWEPVAVPRQ
ncbi:hypothetical protein TruAng_011134 [Truncatella angustata]|nr:hypothetical protein TruAng_011134 [Truncatella angustata]